MSLAGIRPRYESWTGHLTPALTGHLYYQVATPAWAGCASPWPTRPARVRLIVSPVERRLKGGEAAIEQAEIPARKGLQSGLEDQYKWMEMLSRLRSGSPDQAPWAPDRCDDVQDRLRGGSGVFFVCDQALVGGAGNDAVHAVG
jgi:hypothetical protein